MLRILACSVILTACVVSDPSDPSDPDESTVVSDLTVAANTDVAALAGNQLVTSVAVDPTHPDHVLAGAHDPATTFLPAQNELFETTNGGATWTRTSVPAIPTQVGFDSLGMAYALFGSSFQQRDLQGTWRSLGVTGQVFAIDHASNTISVANAQGGGIVVASVLGAGSYIGPFSSSELPVTTSPGLVSLAFLSGGTLVVAWIDPRQQAVMVQPPNTTFPPVAVAKLRVPATGPAAIDVDRSTGPHRDTVYVAWADRGGDYDVFLATSSDDAFTFSPARRVNDDATSTVHDQVAPRLAVDETDGSMNLVWNDTRLDPANRASTVFYARSTDGGATTPNTQLEALGASQTAPQIAARGGVAWPMWSDNRGGEADVYTSRVVGGPDFELAPAAPVAASIDGLATFPIPTRAMYGFSGSIAFAVTSAPAGVRCVWSPASVASGGSTTLYVWPGSLAPGYYPIVVTATSGGIRHLLTLGLQIPDFSIQPPPGPPSAVVRHVDGSVTDATITMQVTPTLGFDASIAIAPVSLPRGIAASVSQTTITFSATASAARGDNTATFSATGGGVTHTFTVDVEVSDDLIVQGDFSGDVTAWSSRGATFSNGAVQLDGGGMIAQFVAIPNDVASATLVLEVQGPFPAAYSLSIAVDDGSQTVTVTSVPAVTDLVTADLRRWRGQTVMIELVASGSTTVPVLGLDNVSLIVGD